MMNLKIFSLKDQNSEIQNGAPGQQSGPKLNNKYVF